MIIKITKWLLLIMAFKIIIALLAAQCCADPRRDIAVRKKLCTAYHPDAIFIGTSRTHFGIDPVLFDSLNQGKTRSYNFGIFNLSPHSAIQIADDILSGSPDVKTIYMELSALDYHTAALQPQQVIQDVLFRINVMADCPNLDFHDKARSFLEGLNTTLFYMVSIAPQILAAKRTFRTKNDPLEGQADLQGNGHQSVTSGLLQTDDRITANKSTTLQMLAVHPLPAPNTYYISQINQLIARAGLMGKKIVFYYPNNITRAEYQILSQVAPFLPDDNLIPLPHHLPDLLFKPENLFDAHHLNREGASIYTRFLQEESFKRMDNL